MYKHIAPALFVLMALVTAAACSGNGDPGQSDRLRVVATVAPVGALTAEVGGDLIELRTLVGAGVDPHAYTISASDRKALNNAAVVLRNGLELDAFIDRALGDERDKVVTVTEGVRLRIPGETGAEEHAEDDGHDHGGVDPHVWQDVGNAKVMVENIAAALAAADPEHEAAYRENAAAYSARLDEVDREIRELIESIPQENRKMVTNHDAFGYFVERYGLELVGTVIPGMTTAAEPSAKEIANLEDLIRREGVKAIFAERTVEPKIARRISADTGVTIVDDLYGDSLGPPGSGAETVDGMLLWNATRIAEALR